MMRPIAAGLAAALVLVFAAGCGERPAARWVDELLLVHERAEALLRGGSARDAAHALAQLPPPPRDVAAQDARAALQDAAARRAAIELSRGDAAAAESAATEGLALGEGGDVFAAALHLARGRAREALGKDREAARDYAAAIAIDEALLDAALGDGGTP